jgi:hypothetical protein
MTKPEAQKMARCIRRSTFVIPKSAINNQKSHERLP